MTERLVWLKEVGNPLPGCVFWVLFRRWKHFPGKVILAIVRSHLCVCQEAGLAGGRTRVDPLEVGVGGECRTEILRRLIGSQGPARVPSTVAPLWVRGSLEPQLLAQPCLLPGTLPAPPPLHTQSVPAASGCGQDRAGLPDNGDADCFILPSAPLTCTSSPQGLLLSSLAREGEACPPAPFAFSSLIHLVTDGLCSLLLGLAFTHKGQKLDKDSGDGAQDTRSGLPFPQP